MEIALNRSSKASRTHTTSLPKPAALQDTRASDAAVSGTPGASVFESKNVSIYYGSFRAVTDVSLTIYENEITAFIGPSGCGKTTVLRTPEPHERPHPDRPGRG